MSTPTAHPNDLGWGELLDTTRTPSPQEIRDTVWRQSGIGRPPQRQVPAPRYVEDAEALAELHKALGMP